MQLCKLQYQRDEINLPATGTSANDVDVACFGWVHQSPVSYSKSTNWLHNVTLNELESGDRYRMQLTFSCG